MAIRKIFALNLIAAALVGCGGGGDVNIAPSTSTVINEGDNNVGGGGEPAPRAECARYVEDGTTFQGSFDGSNCTYSKSFVDLDNPLMVDLTFPNIGDGVHIFEGSLVVGRAYNNNIDLEAAGIDEGGDGPTLTIEAGNTFAFRSSDDYMVINRGSQIRANGRADAPIIMTSQTDAVLNTVSPEAVSEWGGMIINGFGVSNKCAYSGTYPNVSLISGCHVSAEGRAGAGESWYGGDNDDDNSGVLRYFIVKHTGAEVAPGNELNGISFNAVGRGTLVENIQAYSTFDDGIEFFGGAVDVKNYVGLYVRDDSIDLDESYRGTITNALVIQSRYDGNSCVESDGIGSYSDLDQATVNDFMARGLHSQATIENLTCIVSANQTGTHDPGIGIRIREGYVPIIRNALVTTAYSGDDILNDAEANYCLRIENEGQQAALDGDLVIEGSILACQDLTRGDLNGHSTIDWFRANGNAAYQSAEAGEDPTAATNPELVILDGYFSVPVSELRLGTENIPSPVNSDIIGGISADNNWAFPWAYGLEEGNRGQPLWFE